MRRLVGFLEKEKYYIYILIPSPLSTLPRRIKWCKEDFSPDEWRRGVDVKWDIDNSPIRKELVQFQVSKQLFVNVQKSLRVLDPSLYIRSFVGYGDLKSRSTEPQKVLLENSGIDFVQVDPQERLSSAVKQFQKEKANAEQFALANPSNKTQLALAKQFLAQYFTALGIQAPVQPAPNPQPLPGLRPNQPALNAQAPPIFLGPCVWPNRSITQPNTVRPKSAWPKTAEPKTHYPIQKRKFNVLLSKMRLTKPELVNAVTDHCIWTGMQGGNWSK
ncbi:unnamed protein product [Arabis nemorensis]|uniref:Uncharacterized protein n=1 Tax=Arabis nemorensis TaxID=586526 RepID=A0A565BTT6_9BRAS|nr:unnamed protein product [Arabis nemorensis]